MHMLNRYSECGRLVILSENVIPAHESKLEGCCALPWGMDPWWKMDVLRPKTIAVGDPILFHDAVVKRSGMLETMPDIYEHVLLDWQDNPKSRMQPSPYAEWLEIESKEGNFFIRGFYSLPLEVLLAKYNLAGLGVL